MSVSEQRKSRLRTRGGPCQRTPPTPPSQGGENWVARHSLSPPCEGGVGGGDGAYAMRLKTAVAAALVLIALPWLFFKVRDELAIRTDAQAARRLVAAGKYQEASAPLERWIKAKPNAAEPHFLAARGAIGLRLFDLGLAELNRARMLGYPAEAIDRERGIALSRAGRLTEAEPILRKLLMAGRDKKPDPEADEALAKCYHRIVSDRRRGRGDQTLD